MSELCGELWLKTGSPFLSTGDDMTQSAEAASDLSCELCGSSCNERDELIKCEREISRLQAYAATLKATIEREAEYCYGWAASAEMMGDDDRAKRHKERGDRLMASI